jgi:hypothetical protein
MSLEHGLISSCPQKKKEKKKKARKKRLDHRIMYISPHIGVWLMKPFVCLVSLPD